MYEKCLAVIFGSVVSRESEAMMEDTSLQSLRSPVYWLLSSRSGAHEEFLTFWGGEPGGEVRTLPVFSAESSAGAFVEASPFAEGIWRSRKTTRGELISILYGPCVTAGRIALDPLEVSLVESAGSFQTAFSPARFVEALLGREPDYSEEERTSGVLAVSGPRVASRRFGAH